MRKSEAEGLKHPKTGGQSTRSPKKTKSKGVSGLGSGSEVSTTTMRSSERSISRKSPTGRRKKNESKITNLLKTIFKINRKKNIYFLILENSSLKHLASTAKMLDIITEDTDIKIIPTNRDIKIYAIGGKRLKEVECGT